MKYIDYHNFEELRVTTYTKEAHDHPLGNEVKGFVVEAKKGVSYCLETADDIPFVFYAPSAHLFGLTSLSQEETIQEYLKTKMKIVMTQYNLNPKDIYCYFGPSLTFSHVVVSRPTIEKLMDLGYRSAAKRTDGVDFFDMQMMNVVILRNLGIPFANITIDNHDTFENADILYSAMRGDKEKNPTVVELLK
jgi:copper oxidase (laccase) domain-containing protein